MDFQSTIRAFQSILLNFEFQKSSSFSEEFAQKRFSKKMEAPDKSSAEARRIACWEQWKGFDNGLPDLLRLPPSQWYRARLLCHKALEDFSLGDISFSNGSESISNRGQGSIEAKLSSSQWTCTRGNFDLWAKTAYSHRALRVATRKRFLRSCYKDGLSSRQAQQKLSTLCRATWSRLNDEDHIRRFKCFKAVLARVTFVHDFSRFSTVRKNNEKDRPINMENLCNMLVQRRIGNGLRNSLKSFFGVDLDSLSDLHRLMICDLSKATIDLSNASDSVSMALVRFMLPAHVLKLINASRSEFVLDLNGQAHLIKKVSSMGNGFTFELMSFILTCFGKQYDKDFSVFGDDIIINKDVAEVFIKDLCAVGFVVNSDKSFTTGPFRESCGANYHASEGYIRSYDFEYPQNIHDCIVIYNKVGSLDYPSFRKLYLSLTQVLPKSLQGGFLEKPLRPGLDPIDLSSFIRYSPMNGGIELPKKDKRVVDLFRKACCLTADYTIFYGFVYKDSLRSPTRSTLCTQRNWAKYLMYLHSGSKCKDTIRGQGTWSPILYIRFGQSVYRWKDVKKHVNALG